MRERHWLVGMKATYDRKLLHRITGTRDVSRAEHNERRAPVMPAG